jgi:predicted NBD/HSP70 family sugar kinase
VVDLTGAVRASARVASTHRGVPPAVVLGRAADLAAEVSAAAALPLTRATVAVPGLVGPDGIVVSAPNLPGWTGTDVAGLVSPLLGGRPVTAANEADLAALAELWFGDAPPDAVVVSGGIGVGAGLLLGGALLRGPGGRAGELGHVVVDPDGPPCGCGGRGCLEQVAGLAALLRSAGADGLDDLLARRHEPAPAAALAAAARGLGIALAAAVNLLDVPAVVLGGSYPAFGEPLRVAVAAELRGRVVGRPDVTVRLAAPDTGGSLRAAGAAAVRTLLAEPGPGPTH